MTFAINGVTAKIALCDFQNIKKIIFFYHVIPKIVGVLDLLFEGKQFQIVLLDFDQLLNCKMLIFLKR